MTKNEKISASLKKRFSETQHHCTGKTFRSKTDEEKAHLSRKAIEAADRKGRLSDKDKRARNVANVVAYRARLKNAIAPDSDLLLIRKIYECCPTGYHVDHITALAESGLHHQDNLQYLEGPENCRKGKNHSYDQSKAISWQTLMLH